MVYFDLILRTNTFPNCLDTGRQNGDEASSSIRSAGRVQLVKMFTTLEAHGIF